jgi:CDP-diacylglycerol--serine O-phosphatidyltransferase
LARALKATSKFGVQMDSLADIVNFGVAPALVLYFMLLNAARPLGWIACLIFAIACCLRLARFNVLTEDTNRKPWDAEYFVGVPAPAGAALVLLPVYLIFLGVEPTKTFAYASAGFIVFVAFLLVSRLPVYSGKKIRMSRHMALPWLLGAVVFVLFLAYYTWETLAFAAVVYLLHLPIGAKAYSRRAKAEEAAEQAASQV